MLTCPILTYFELVTYCDTYPLCMYRIVSFDFYQNYLHFLATAGTTHWFDKLQFSARKKIQPTTRKFKSSKPLFQVICWFYFRDTWCFMSWYD